MALMESIASGGLIGFIGSLVGGILKYYQTKQQQTYEQAKWEYELKLLEEERLRTSCDDQRGDITPMNSELTMPNSKWVIAIKALYRPILTTILVTTVFFLFSDLLDRNIILLEKVTTTLTFCCSTAVVWWFGDRSFTATTDKNR